MKMISGWWEGFLQSSEISAWVSDRHRPIRMWLRKEAQRDGCCALLTITNFRVAEQLRSLGLGMWALDRVVSSMAEGKVVVDAITNEQLGESLIRRGWIPEKTPGSVDGYLKLTFDKSVSTSPMVT
jgi:hypothetical protein